MKINEITQRDMDPITLQRTLQFARQRDADIAANPNAPRWTSQGTLDMIKQARAQDKRNRISNTPAHAHRKDGVHKQGFKPVVFPPTKWEPDARTKVDLGGGRRDVGETILQAIEEHINRGVPFRECIFRPGSTAFREFYRTVRDFHSQGLLECDWEDEELLETDIGELIKVNGEVVPLDVPFIAEQEVDEASCGEKGVKPNSPKRGGSKKFYVYVNDPKTGNCKKISWGDKGLSVKSGSPGRVKSFVARHKCKQKKDKTKAGYWACRTPRYKSLGVKGGQWW